jgi:hypothetical protein
MQWAEGELAEARLGDPRRLRRAVKLLTAWAEQPEQSIPLASGGKAEAKGAYRFLENEAVSSAALIEAHARATATRAAQQAEVWVAQDTTSLDFSRKPATQGLGPLDSIYTRGLKVHSALAMSPEGVPLGLLHQQVWARDAADGGTRYRRRQRSTSEKESQRWITTVERIQERVSPGVHVWVMGDAESDLYALFAAPRTPETDLLVRAAQDRCVHVEPSQEVEHLWAAVDASPVRGERIVELGRTPQRRARSAHLAMRFCAVRLLPPRHAKQRTQLPPVPLWAVEVREIDPPPGIEGIHWLLLSTRAVECEAEAWRCVEAYTRRWLVERFHFVLKRGCRIEELQLERAERLERALALYSIVAWRLLWVCYTARQDAQAPCSVALEADEWKALSLQKHRHAPPQVPPPLGEAVRWIAELGGFLGTRTQAPGVMTLWRGWRRLEDLTHGYRLALLVGNA